MCFLLLQQGTPYLNTSLGQSRVRPANTKHALLWAEKMKRWSRAALAYAGPCLFVFGLMETWHPRDILMEASTSPITCFHSVNMSLYLKDFRSLLLPTVRRTYHETRCWKWRARLWKLESSWSQFWIFYVLDVLDVGKTLIVLPKASRLPHLWLGQRIWRASCGGEKSTWTLWTVCYTVERERMEPNKAHNYSWLGL